MNFGCCQINSIMSTDPRSERDEVRTSTLKYLKDYKHFEVINDEKLTEKEVVWRKNGTIKNISVVSEWFILSLSEKCFNYLPKSKGNVAHCQYFKNVNHFISLIVSVQKMFECSFTT